MQKLKTSIKLVAFADRLNLTGSFFPAECWRRVEWVWGVFVFVVFLGLGGWLVGLFGVCEMEAVFHEGLMYEILHSNTIK